MRAFLFGILWLSGCIDAPERGIEGRISIPFDPSACLGGEDIRGGETCRGRLETAGAGRACLVWRVRDGAGVLEGRWSDPVIAWEGPLLLPPGATVEAALYLMRGEAPCPPSPAAACEGDCLLALHQNPTGVAEGVVLDFRGIDGDCHASQGLMPFEERCDGFDNTCDGQVDESFARLGETCEAGMGACRREGEWICGASGAEETCDAEPRPATDEVCDGVDNDCDGQVDDGLSLEDCCDVSQAPITCGQPVAGSVCMEGTRACEPFPGQDGSRGRLGLCLDILGEPVVLPNQQPETCDQVDNDCDGELDEDLVLVDADQTQPGDQPAPVGGLCRVLEGDCVAEGDVICAGGQPSCDHSPIVRGDEVCDRGDNDCDGHVDETFADQGLGEVCSAGVGACQANGRRACAPDQDSVICNAQPGEALDLDLCGNNLDDDCDGRLDEGHPSLGQACVAGEGACRDNGGIVCSADGRSTECSAQPRQPADEQCNAIDDDCDGRLDEDFDTQGDPENCGLCGRVCDLFNAVAECNGGECAIESCLEGSRDLDRRADNGCECNPNEPDLPDPTFTDSNCDGVDGVVARAIFVSMENGNDRTGDGSPAAPFQTLARGVEVARALADLNNFRDIYLDAGTYDVTQGNADPEASRTGILVPGGVSIYGGYDYILADGIWGRGPALSTRITGAQIVLRYQGNVQTGLGRHTLLDNVVIETSAVAESPLPTAGVVAVDVGNDLTLRNVQIVSHDGAPGSDGADGQGVFTAGRGGGGLNGNQPGNPGGGGGGGTNVGCSFASGGRGGNGGMAGAVAQAGQWSPDAANNPRAGAGGPVGGRGEDGDAGAHGANEGPGGASGRVDASGRFWIARSGIAAGTGAQGGPGGGGGGGPNVGAERGGGGGGGGAGGCAGSGGRGAEGGAASIGLQILGGTLHLQNVSIRSGSGGPGGGGGTGGPGAPGGEGGLGGLGERTAASGGDGGDGGPGGCGGHAGGGAGGPSFAILRISPSTIAADLARSTFVFEGYDGRALPDQGAETLRVLQAGQAGQGGGGGMRAGCGPQAAAGSPGVANRVGCCANGRGAGNCNALHCE